MLSCQLLPKGFERRRRLDESRYLMYLIVTQSVSRPRNFVTSARDSSDFLFMEDNNRSILFQIDEEKINHFEGNLSILLEISNHFAPVRWIHWDWERRRLKFSNISTASAGLLLKSLVFIEKIRAYYDPIWVMLDTTYSCANSFVKKHIQKFFFKYSRLSAILDFNL